MQLLYLMVDLEYILNMDGSKSHISQILYLLAVLSYVFNICAKGYNCIVRTYCALDLDALKGPLRSLPFRGYVVPMGGNRKQSLPVVTNAECLLRLPHRLRRVNFIRFFRKSALRKTCMCWPQTHNLGNGWRRWAKATSTLKTQIDYSHPPLHVGWKYTRTGKIRI